MTVDTRRMSEADRAGLVARSPEGHAAKSMHIRGREEEWVKIQANTFKNWVNVNLKECGLQVQDLSTDFSDGVRLVALVETLQKRKLRHNKKPASQPHALENITIALDAIKEDGIKLVNIGNTDIQNGNDKLIMGLIWSLIAHYQLGASNFPPKKLMLAWLRAVLPDCNIKNFTSDWNNGIALSALLDYCRPGLMSNWNKLSPGDGLGNCERAMKIAEREFKIPMVLEPEHFASPHLDELSGMTYLSYFMKEEDSPGYTKTLSWAKNQIPVQRINNFRTDWNDGLAASALVKSKGGPVPGFKQMDNYPQNWTSNLEIAMTGARKLGVSSVMDKEEMANPNVEYLGVMAWVAQFQWIPDKTGPGEMVEIKMSNNKCRVGEKCEFLIDILDSDVALEEVSAEVNGPSGPINIDFDTAGGRGVFEPKEFGMHEVLVKNEGESVKGSPHFMRSMPNSKKDYDGIEPCAVGSTVEVLINPHHAARPDLLEVTAYSPTNRPLGCPVSEDNGTFYASFQPDEAGEWKIHVTYDGEDIENSPFKCMVFDPRAIFIPDQDAARAARPGNPFTFTVDASKSGWGEVAIDVVYDNRSIKRTMFIEEIRHRVYQVTFTPQSRGKHRVYVYLNGMEVKGSAFSLRIGKDVKETKVVNRNEAFKADRKMSGRYKKFDEQKEERRTNFTEKEVHIQKPVAPPRNKKGKRQSFREFKDENTQSLFQSDHQTDDGMDLLPVKKTIAFDCPDNGASIGDIHVTITDASGKKCPSQIKANHNGTFTCEFTTSVVGEHKIEIIINDELLNVTPHFYTYDVTKIKVGQIPPAYIGLPVEFEILGAGAGFGNLEIIVNGGRVTSHVTTVTKEHFTANFIPHDPGRHRIDVKFNGEKVPNSPWFSEVKDPNTPLMSPGLLAQVANPGRARSPAVNGNGHSNGYDTIDTSYKTEKAINGFSDKKVSSFKDTKVSSFSDTKVSSFNDTKVSSFNDTKVSSFADNKVSNFNAELENNSLFQQSKKEASTSEFSSTSKFESNQSLAKENDEASSSIKKTTYSKMDPSRDFGSYSPLNSISLLLGNKSSKTDEHSSNHLSSKEQSSNHVSTSLMSSNLSTTSKELRSSIGNIPKTTYTSTIERSVNVGELSSPKLMDIKVMGKLNDTQRSSTLPKSLKKSSLDKNGPSRGSTSGLATSHLYSSTTKSQGLNSALSGSQDLSVMSSSSYTSSYSKSSQNMSSIKKESVLESSTTSNGLGVPPLPAVGPPSPKLTSYKGTAEKCTFVGETVRHFNAGKPATFELFAPGNKKGDVEVNIISPEKRHIPHKVVESGNGVFRIEFTTVEVGSYVIDVTVSSLSVPNSPLIAKAYDAGLIRVTDIVDGVAGDISSFRVDASKAGEGQLEISINDGDVPNAVQVLGGGKCLVTYTPEQAITHEIEVMFNNDQVPGSPFLCRVKDTDDLSYGGSSGGFSKVQVELEHLGLIPVNIPSEFTIKVPEGADAELAVSVQGPVEDIPVKVTGNVRNGFTAEFLPKDVGLHVVLVEYNGVAVGGTPFYSKAYDSEGVAVSDIPKGTVGKTVTFAVDAGQAGEGNLEIFVIAGRENITPKVQPIGNAVFNVSFVPKHQTNHLIHVTFNDENVPGSPFTSAVSDAKVLTQAQTHNTHPVQGKSSYFSLSNVTGSVQHYDSAIKGSSRY